MSSGDLTQRLFCSNLAKTSTEPLLGTAHHVRGFILITWPRKLWGRQHFQSRGLPPTLVDQLKRTQKAHRYFLRLISTGSADDSMLSVYVMPENRVLRFATVDEVAPALAKIFDCKDEVDRAALEQWEPNRTDLLLCCTNGARDRCCAKFGFGVFLEAKRIVRERRLPLEIYQCTHLTGDRFAACALALPSGDLYGWLRRETVAPSLNAIARRVAYLPNFRGNSYLGEVDQIIGGVIARRAQCIDNDPPSEWIVERSDSEDEVVATIRRKSTSSSPAQEGVVVLGRTDFSSVSDCDELDQGKAGTVARWTVISATWG